MDWKRMCEWIAREKSNAIKKIENKLFCLTGIGRVVRNVHQTSYKKNCLLIYITAPFIDSEMHSHQNSGHVIAISEIISELYYNVDVIDFDAKHVLLWKKYDLIFEITIHNNPVYKTHIKENAKKIFFATGSDPSFSNKAELERLNEVKKRRGADLLPRRQVEVFPKEIERYNGVIIIGNNYTLSTYIPKYHFKKCFLVSNTGYHFEIGIDWTKKRANCFLFLGSSGSVHKGLDLLLEVFSEPGFPAELFICGYYDQEEDFRIEYNKELFDTQNIHPMGFADIYSEKFKAISDICCFTLLPSCAEGQSGTITTCMSSGIIPICSKMCGYDDNEVINLTDCKKDTIRNKVLEVSAWNLQRIKQESSRMIELTNGKFSMNQFIIDMRNAITETLDDE